MQVIVYEDVSIYPVYPPAILVLIEMVEMEILVSSVQGPTDPRSKIALSAEPGEVVSVAPPEAVDQFPALQMLPVAAPTQYLSAAASDDGNRNNARHVEYRNHFTFLSLVLYPLDFFQLFLERDDFFIA